MKETASTYLQILRPWRGRALTVVGLFGLSGVMEGAALLALGGILQLAAADRADAGFLGGLFAGADDALAFVIGLFFVFGSGAAACRWFAERSALGLRVRIEEAARRDLAHALANIDWSRYIALRHGDISKSLIVEGMQIASGASSFLSAMGAIVVSLAYLATALAVSPTMSVIAVLFGLGGAMAYRLVGPTARKYSDQLSSLASRLGERVGDIFGNLKYFRSTGAAAAAEQRAAEIFREYGQTYLRSQAYIPGLRSAFEAGGVLVIAAFFFWRLRIEHDSVAAVLVFLAIFYRLAPRLLAVQDNMLQSATFLSWYRTWHDRIEFSRAHPQPHYGTHAPSFADVLEMTGVSFSFANAPEPVLRDVNLQVRPGECIALVGGSGGGKSTLVDLLTGLFAPSRGRITLDGRRLAEVDQEQWRGHLGLVLQDSPLFHESVFDNIVWGEARRDRDAAIEAAKLAHAWDFIERLPQGLDTVLGERGARLSGGQRQRIAIARALYRRPWLLILDEATSALDGESEAAIQAALEELKGRFAILIVAHRLKTVAMADRIYVVEDGVIAETGVWAELVAKNGRFSRLLASQALP